MLDIPRKVTTLAQVGETVVSRCFVGCLGQTRERCSNRCCCGVRNYASDIRPTHPLAAGVESSSQTLAPGVVFCTSTAGMVRHVKCLTFLHRIFDDEKILDVKNGRFDVKFHFTFDIFFTFDFTSLHFVAAKTGP